jgi:hypothetical protein
MLRGIDRKELPDGVPISQLRDIFFGTLEFSARTLKLRNQSYDQSIVTNLLALMGQSVTLDKPVTIAPEPSNSDLMRTLESIRDQLTPRKPD